LADIFSVLFVIPIIHIERKNSTQKFSTIA